MSDPTWKDLCEKAVMSERFKRAWREVGSRGIGSALAAQHVGGLISDSEWHRRHIDTAVDETIGQMQKLVEQEDDDSMIAITKLMRIIRDRLWTMATVYCIIGTLVGIGSIPNDDDSEIKGPIQ